MWQQVRFNQFVVTSVVVFAKSRTGGQAARLRG